MAQKQVTRDVPVAVMRHLLAHPRRATVAFVDDAAVELLPARFRFSADAYLFGVRGGDTGIDLTNREVVLLIDDGEYWFELRGVSVRGVAMRVDPPEGEPDRLVWHAVEPRRVLAWDYGTIREE